SAAAPSSMGAHTNADSKRTTSHCLGQWITARSWFVELRRASQDCVPAVATPCLLSAVRAAGHVQEDEKGDRGTYRASFPASEPAFRRATAHDTSRSGARDGAGDRGIPG